MDEKKEQSLLARLFELRSVIGILFGVFGVVCLVWGLGFTSAAELKKAAGVNINVWTGIAMLVFAAAFIAWAALGAKPEEAAHEDSSAPEDAPAGTPES